MAFFRDLLDGPLSLGRVHSIVRQAVRVAQPVNAAQDLSRVQAGSHDELFQAGLPVLAGMDLDSTYCYLLAAEAHRDAETWGIHLLDLAAQGLHPDYTVADGARGLRAGQAWAWPGVPRHGDVLHGLRALTRLSATLERRAYAAIAQRDALEQQMRKAKQHRQGRALSQRLARARVREASALRLADEVHTLTHWMQHDILALAGPDASTRQTLYDFVMERLQALETLDAQHLRPVRQSMVNPRDALRAFATRLDQALDALAQRFAVPVLRLRHVLALQERAPTTPAYGSQGAAWQRSLHGQFDAIDQALRELRRRLHRASSLVENLNSRLRSYFFQRNVVVERPAVAEAARGACTIVEGIDRVVGAPDLQRHDARAGEFARGRHLMAGVEFHGIARHTAQAPESPPPAAATAQTSAATGRAATARPRPLGDRRAVLAHQPAHSTEARDAVAGVGGHRLAIRGDGAGTSGQRQLEFPVTTIKIAALYAAGWGCGI
jgi:hypothetical protein